MSTNKIWSSNEEVAPVKKTRKPRAKKSIAVTVYSDANNENEQLMNEVTICNDELPSDMSSNSNSNNDVMETQPTVEIVYESPNIDDNETQPILNDITAPPSSEDNNDKLNDSPIVVPQYATLEDVKTILLHAINLENGFTLCSEQVGNLTKYTIDNDLLARVEKIEKLFDAISENDDKKRQLTREILKLKQQKLSHV